VVFLPAVVFAVVLLLTVADGFGCADDCWAGGYCCEDSEYHALEKLVDGGEEEGGERWNVWGGSWVHIYGLPFGNSVGHSRLSRARQSRSHA
jgi:hypothetical protein